MTDVDTSPRFVTAPRDMKVQSYNGAHSIQLKKGVETRINYHLYVPAVEAGCTVDGASVPGLVETEEDIHEKLVAATLEIIGKADKKDLRQDGRPRLAALKMRVERFNTDQAELAFQIALEEIELQEEASKAYVREAAPKVTED